VKTGRCVLSLSALALVPAILAAFAPCASAQALPTATQLYSLSAWGGTTGTFINLPPTASGGPIASPVVGGAGSPSSLFNGGKNLGISAGVDLRVWQYHRFLPSVEVRGTYPIASGNVAGEENVLGGVKVEYLWGSRYHPYADFFFGREEIKYQAGGYISPDRRFLFLQSISNVFSPGGGIDIDVTHHFAAKVDAQLWHTKVPVTTSGSLNSLALTAGVIYRFDFNKRPKIPRQQPTLSDAAPSSPNTSR